MLQNNKDIKTSVKLISFINTHMHISMFFIRIKAKNPVSEFPS